MISLDIEPFVKDVQKSIREDFKVMQHWHRICFSFDLEYLFSGLG